jgi:UDP-N-acetylmuramate--alanine ligase
VATELGIDNNAIQIALKEFKGVGRRFQRCGDIAITNSAGSAGGKSDKGSGSYTLIDDYGHHPVEIEATMQAARGAFPGRRLVIVFQPHRYTRTRDLFEDFVRVLGKADQLILAEVYSAGEPPLAAADSKALARSIRVAGHVEPVYVEAVAQLPEAIHKTVKPNDVVVVMGAGSIGTVPAMLKNKGAAS